MRIYFVNLIGSICLQCDGNCIVSPSKWLNGQKNSGKTLKERKKDTVEYIKTVMIMGCINMIAVCGMVLLTGYTGIFSMGHAGFMAVGGYTATILYMYVGVPYIMAVLLGGVAAGLVSVIVGYPTLKGKLTGDYFAIATLGFGEIVRLIVANVKPVLGGAMGIHDIPRLTTLWVVLVFTIIDSLYKKLYKISLRKTVLHSNKKLLLRW